MQKLKRGFYWVLIVLNLVVLLGQLWPEGAPPFARSVNIVFLCLTLLVFAARLWSLKKAKQPEKP